ncbi:MAG: DNA methylase [Clostridiales bacterium]|nr:DNA methylase [Clostridiales bacterium]
MEQTSEKTYICIDLKSFYASVECADRGLDALKTNLVVADLTRTEKTICLAVTPSLKAYGISGRARLFEVIQRVREINCERRMANRGRRFTGKSSNDDELKADPSLELDYIVARPRMARYVEVSTAIYNVYLRYISPEDIHVYSIDEVFIDATSYINTYRLTARELAMALIGDVLKETGITATVGIGTNLYLAKIAMDIDAKHMPPDENGVRISELNEMTYRERLWDHRPITDFWRIGPGIASRLEKYGMHTMGDIALCSVGKGCVTEDFLYKLFGINAELIIDHAWGYEPCTMQDIKAYRPRAHSVSMGQVLMEPYDFKKAELVVREMADNLAMDLFTKGLVTDKIDLAIGYDIENIKDPERRRMFKGTVSVDHYGREKPKSAHGSVNIKNSSSCRIIADAATALFERITDRTLLIRRINIAALHASLPELESEESLQLDLFSDPEDKLNAAGAEKKAIEADMRRQEAVMRIRDKFGKNAILRGMNYEEGATARMRNAQIGGHRSGDGEKAEDEKHE